MNKTKKKLLDIVWKETTNGLGANRRYIAKSYGSGGTGWGVYDRVKGCYLSRNLDELNNYNIREEMREA